MVPVIRDHVKNTHLAFFISYFIPLASTLKQRGKCVMLFLKGSGDSIFFCMCINWCLCSCVLAEELEQAGQKLEAKVYQTLQLQVAWHWLILGLLRVKSFSEWVVETCTCVLFLQIWTMLPGFCTCPVDLLASFKSIARVLGMAINEHPDLRLTVCHALRIIINKSCSTGRKMHMFTERDYTLKTTATSWIASFQNPAVSALCFSRGRKDRIGPLLQELPAHLLQRIQPAACSGRVRHLQDGCTRHHQGLLNCHSNRGAFACCTILSVRGKIMHQKNAKKIMFNRLSVLWHFLCRCLTN